ncbi:tRNA1(Val) (adenine(37)-N6)-methyltransferase [Sediminicola luteus]|uniref:tRNA1(Val) (adenine(37)-N6)-methyltransferase n=1 Tax=Sediminicola luteus TaxID=319238 RepID=A0A2A4GEC8_9FLAO|nr:methyltransferase [Sediminicola luteus]PCE66102.1 tRNA (adenine-N(6)-)-methyltransferase [Sediminicola luteus]
MAAFRFKEFSIEQDQCAMKVGTDGVLLGAWAGIDHEPDSILDIGAGTGIIALMLAQRSHAETIDALELDNAAYEQCVGNFEASPWADRLFCYHAALLEFAQEMDEPYDLIVCNPPFYSESVSSGNTQRDQARQNDSMPFTHLLTVAAHFLTDTGRFCMIAPFKEEKQLLKLGTSTGLYPTRICRVRGNDQSPIKRSLLEFGKQTVDVETTELTIEVERHQYTTAYKQLTQDFYLKM